MNNNKIILDLTKFKIPLIRIKIEAYEYLKRKILNK